MDQLVKIDDVNPYDADVKEMVKSSGFAYISLKGTSAKEVQKGDFKGGNFALVEGGDLKDLGATFDAVVIAWRPKAVDCSDTENLVITHDTKSADFKRITLESGSKDQEVKNGKMWGPEYLLWLPEQEGFYPYHMSNPTSRNAADQFQKRIGGAITIENDFIETKKFSWFGPKGKDCLNPISPLPSPEAVAEARKAFLYPKEEKVVELEGSRER